MKRLSYRDFGVKGMKKGRHKVEQEQTAIAKPNKKRALKSAAKAVGAGVVTGAAIGGLSALPGYLRSRGVVKEAAKRTGASPRAVNGLLKNVVNKVGKKRALNGLAKGGLVGGALGLGALGAVALSQHMRNKKKARKDSLRRYHDSQYKLAIAKRQYRDALRRYRDAEGEARASKIRALIDKYKNKLKDYLEKNPESRKKIIKVIDIINKVGTLLGIVSTAGLIKLTADDLRLMKKYGLSLKEAAPTLPSDIIHIVWGIAGTVIGFSTWAAINKAKKEEDI